MGTRRQFSREFKVEAVNLVKERGVTVSQAARDLNVHETVRRKAHPPLVDARLGSQSVGLTRHPASHVTRPATCCLPQIIAAMRWNAARKPGRGNRAGFLRSAA